MGLIDDKTYFLVLYNSLYNSFETVIREYFYSKNTLAVYTHFKHNFGDRMF